MRARRFLGPAVILLAVAAQMAPALVGRVYRFEDIAAYFEPLWAAAARAMLDGRWPTWDAGAWSGQPLLGDPQLGVFYPLNWLWLALPTLRAYALSAALHLGLGGLGMYALARARGASRPASTVAGLALGVGGYMVLQVRHVMFVQATAWLPWVALCGWRYLDDRRLRWLAAMAAATGMMFLTGGVSMIYYGLWFLVALLAARAIAVGRFWGERVLLLCGLALAGAIGLLLAAPMLAPMVAHGPLSPRAKGTEYAFVASIAWKGLHYLPTLFIPNLLGQEARGDYVGGGTQWEIAGYYAGVLPFALAVVAWVAGPRQRRGERLALAAIALLALGLATGAASPLHRLAYRHLPLYDAMRCPPRALYVFVAIVPLLAADGLDLVAGWLGRGRARLEAWAPRAAVLLVALDLLLTHRAENPSRTLDEAQRMGRPAALAALAAHPGDRYVNDVHAAHALHNSGLLWGRENASGYSSLPIWRYLHYLWIANHGATYPHEKLHDDISAQGIWRYGSPLVDGLSVRWVLSQRPVALPHFVRRFAAPDGLDLWENTRALPRAWIVGRARVVEGAEASARAIAGDGFDPRREVVLEAPPAVAPDPEASGTVEEQAREATRVRLRVDLARPAVLVMSDPHYPGWAATVDGKPAPLLLANHALRAVALAPGRHEVELRFASAPLARGLRLLAGGLLAIALLLVADRRLRTRPREGRRAA